MNEVAIVGFYTELPGIEGPEELWKVVVNNRCTLSPINEKELLDAGVSQEEIDDPSYVKWGGFLDKARLFDPAFFSMTQMEANKLDPQHRVFLRVAYKALEQAGYGKRKGLKTGVFASCGINTYLLDHILGSTPFAEFEKDPFSLVGNSTHFLATRVGYKCDCTGPCVTLQTGCSSSLLALHYAKEAIVRGECDLALAGGVAIPHATPQGYHYTSGGVASPDGKCLAFDKESAGTVFTSGSSVLVLRSLKGARRAGDTIYGVIKATVVNNDGENKPGFTAPSMQGQAALITKALEVSGVDPESITYLETHGTATSLGDPIEFAALKEAFEKVTSKKQFCRLGALKNNIGHVDVAAGASGVIKILMAMRNKTLPGMTGFTGVNPRIDLENSPFVISREPEEWKVEGAPRRCGISAFGIGGTNAHAIIEEAPDETRELLGPEGSGEVILVSAKSESGGEVLRESVSAFIKERKDLSLRDVSYTLKVGRKEFAYRSFCSSGKEREMTSWEKNHLSDRRAKPVFLFSGQGSQYFGMARELFAYNPLFREVVLECFSLFENEGIKGLKEVVFGKEGEQIHLTLYTQPALFCIEYALAKVLLSLGVVPAMVIGHSLGEYVALCFAEVITLKDATKILAKRAQLLSTLKGTGMLAVYLAAEELMQCLPDDLDLAVDNAPSLCVLSGPDSSLCAFQEWLEERGIMSRPLKTSAGFHSRYTRSILDQFKGFLQSFKFQEPTYPIVSNVSGELLKVTEGMAEYLTTHICSCVHFRRSIQTVVASVDSPLFVEVGPGCALTTLVSSQLPKGSVAINLLPHPKSAEGDWHTFEKGAAKMWLHGIDIDWAALYPAGYAKKVACPNYPFEERVCWMERGKKCSNTANPLGKNAQVNEWFYTRKYVEVDWLDFRVPHPETVLVIANTASKVPFSSPKRISWAELGEERSAECVVCFLPQSPEELVMAFHSLVSWMQNDIAKDGRVKRLEIVGKHMTDWKGRVCPEAAPFIAFAKALAQEVSYLNCRCIDLYEGAEESLAFELTHQLRELLVILDGKRRFIEAFKPAMLTSAEERLSWKNIVIFGGLGRMGMYYSIALSPFVKNKIILVSRSLKEGEALKDVLLRSAQRKKMAPHFLEQIDKYALASCDITSETSMRETLMGIQKEHGSLDLVIHAAGVEQTEHTKDFMEIDTGYLDSVMDVKKGGLINLRRVQEDVSIGSIGVVSSISSTLGGINLFAYTASHLFVDAFVQNSDPGWFVLGWDALAMDGSEEERHCGSGLDRLAIKDREAIGVARRHLELKKKFSSLTCSTAELGARYEAWLTKESVSDEMKRESHKAPRPVLRTLFVAATTPQQKQIESAWQEVLGLESIGIKDNFFELGGDSLSALEVARSLSDTMKKRVKVTLLFERPTIEGVADALFPSNGGSEKGPASGLRAQRRQEALKQFATSRDRG